MSLLLDPRRRAMLREMGVAVWQPEPVSPLATIRPVAPSARAPLAMNVVAANAHPERAEAVKDSWSKAAETVRVRPVLAESTPDSLAAVPASAIVPAPAQRTGVAAAGAPVWQLGATHLLYAEPAAANGKSRPARWLVLGETPAAALQTGGFDPLAGEAGALLGNMLRAARLPSAASVLFVPLARLLPSSPLQAGLAEALAPLLAETQPDIVLLMGRLAAQAALKTDEPLGQLRGRVHRLQGCAIVLTYDAAHLLRNPDNKAKAWDDLCLATHFVAGLQAAPGD